MTTRWLRLTAVFATTLLGATLARAQDTHYWSIQYGPVGQLVGGQLIGGATDLSSTYYNPGALVLRNESSYLLSTESFQLETLSTEPSPGLTIFDTSSSHFGAAPALLAGILPRWLGQDTQLAWSFLTRQKLDVRLGERVDDPLAGASHSAAESYFDQDASEYWAGLTASHALSESVGLGMTLYGVYRGQRLRSEVSVEGIGAGGSSLTALGVKDFQYYHYRTLAKIGLSWHTGAWKTGLTITTPSLSVLGSGKSNYTISLAGIDTDGDTFPNAPSLVAQTAEDLETHFRSSWAVGAGASRSLGATRIYASAEWYAPIDRFTVIEVPPGSLAEGRLTQEFGSVLNAGVGFEHILSDDLSLYGAFHTDFSASVGSPQANIAVSDWDIYHLSGGVSFRIHENRFTMGASWAQGGKTRALDTPIPAADVPASFLASQVDLRYSKLTFLLGFVFGR